MKLYNYHFQNSSWPPNMPLQGPKQKPDNVLPRKARKVEDGEVDKRAFVFGGVRPKEKNLAEGIIQNQGCNISGHFKPFLRDGSQEDIKVLRK